ncbi:F-box only 21 [Brachionus plicatilis]|uniref:F-box only 21 n=1 Tax=Brachionus plicatilis TaxID=10195 RepID=A0A3M7RZQ8_BRAPC|nr:F-box only 21 [Brachionus plicatilis]
MDRIDYLKFVLIAMALPTQYLITQYWSNDNVEQSIALKNLASSFHSIKSYFELDAWKKWYLSFVLDKPGHFKGPKVFFKKSKHNEKDIEDDIAVEVLKFRKQLVNFAESSVTRSPRPSKVIFRVGQVVFIKRLNIHGVIIGWDEKCNAPSDWVEQNYEMDERNQIMNQPHYLLLVDEKDEYMSDKVYVFQDDLVMVTNRKIKHRILNSFFKKFDGGQYLKNKYLHAVYPHD